MFSCKQSTFDSPEELMSFVVNPENGYRQERSVNGIDISITYRPTDMLVQQELSKGDGKEKVDSLRAKYIKYMYFNVSLGKNGQEVLNGMAGNSNKFGTMVNQLAFGMREKVHVFSKTKDTVELADYIYPRLYGMGGNTSMLFVYPRDKKLLKNDFFNITIEDIGLNTGEVGFKIPVKPIKNEPVLTL
ncbi:hypothetical protein D9V96_020435 [Zobellia laminariae]|uniref:hypothetical protein n=1 Tax=Zobellia laminariae TaxID=248906 RepID=UPI00405789DE